MCLLLLSTLSRQGLTDSEKENGNDDDEVTGKSME